MYLSERGRWDEEWQFRIEEQATEAIERSVELAESLPAPTADDMFGSMFESLTPNLVEQRFEARRLGGLL